MSNNPAQIIKDGKVVDNSWEIVAADAESIPTGQVIVALDQWQNAKDKGVWLANDTDFENIDDSIISAPVIAIEFPAFMDGRGFSLARIIRERLNYKGELRAFGHIIRDQLCYLSRCGFNAFEMDESVNLEAAVASLTDFSEAYQAASDEEQPLFRRRATA